MGRRYINGIGPVPAWGMLIGEAPGEWEHRKGEPFVGMSGQVLDSVLRSCTLRRDQLYITNAYKSWTGPGNPTPTERMLDEDQELPDDELRRVRPRVIGTLGLTATRRFLGDVTMEEVHGLTFRKRIGARNVVIVPVYHPAAGLYSPELMVQCFRDMNVFSRVLKRGDSAVVSREDQFLSPVYSTDIDWYLRKYPNGLAAVDTEGTPEFPFCVTVSTCPGTALIVTATDPIGLRKVGGFLVGRLVILRNALWDLPVLRAMGINLLPGRYRDSMILAFLTQVEPQGLKPLAFRHAAMEMVSYAELTQEYEDKLHVDYLWKAMNLKYRRLSPVQEFTGAQLKVRTPAKMEAGIEGILRSWAKGTKRPSAWLAGLSAEAREILEEKAGPIPRFHLGMVPWKKVIRYACRDADATLRVYPKLRDQVEAMKLGGISDVDHSVIPIVDFMQSKGLPSHRQYFLDYRDKLIGELTKDLRKFCRRYTGGKHFNPNSTDQCGDLLFNTLGLESTRLTKSRTKLSTDDDVLKALVGQHPAVAEIDAWREKDKLRQFTEAMAEATIGERLLYRAKLTRIYSGRISTGEPINVTALPARSEGGKLRKGIRPHNPEWCMASCDLSQIEIKVMAHISQDPAMLEVIRKGRDLHSETAMKILGCKPDQVKDKKYRVPAKTINFGIGYMISDEGLHTLFIKNGVTEYSVADAGIFIREWYKVYRGIKRAQDLAAVEARRNGYIREPGGGRIRYLPNIHSPMPWLRAEAERQAFNHKVQGMAQWVMKRGMARFWEWLEKQALLDRVWPVLQIHDDQVMELNRKMVPRVQKAIVGCLTADSSMFSVPITADFSSGDTWGDL